MKKIKIFLGSSIMQFEKERYELTSFIEQISRQFRDAYDVDIEPFICEQYDHAIAKDGRMQDAFNAELTDSDMAFFLFYTHLGEFTKEEFETAFQCLRESPDGKPKIYTYLRNCSLATRSNRPLRCSCRCWNRRSDTTMSRSAALIR